MAFWKTCAHSSIMRNISIGAVLMTVSTYQHGLCDSKNIVAVNVDTKGVMTSMVVTNPQTYLNIEKEFDFDVDDQGNPTKGTVKFLDGIERQLNVPEELTLMWQQFGGPQEYWNNAKKQGKIIAYTSMDELPNGVFGKQVRLYLNDGKEFIGKLSKSANHAESFSLNTGGSQPLQIDKAIIREIQQVK
ncbi:MAG: hypothetical protein WBM07_07520 [Chitinivibrionales bacterium]